ncbi:hypothetical protein [Sodalis sp. RH20]|uniref:hypothetical protein n=1 Tax=unclassified Sodalis (in: enterobacteria) TaxID=2636512 RepID=UPI0039B663CF
MHIVISMIATGMPKMITNDSIDSFSRRQVRLAQGAVGKTMRQNDSFDSFPRQINFCRGWRDGGIAWTRRADARLSGEPVHHDGAKAPI